MLSSLTWLDQDSTARDRSLRILALFQEKESRDELGIGAIRDAIADRLFPGTSTIQTRLRYMLIIPWMYQRLEDERVSAREFSARARKDELALTRPLLDAGAEGVFGRVAQGALKRLPSSVYWAGLGAWSIRRYAGPQSDYHRAVDTLYARRDRARKRDNDDDVQHDPSLVTWHSGLPKAPKGFPETVDLTLRPEEGSFLVDCIRATHRESLLGWLVLNGEPDDTDAPWGHHQHGSFPLPMRTLLHHARLFADLVEGAARVYNIALAVQRGDTALAGDHRAELARWRDRIDWAALGDWSLDMFWDEVTTPNHTITTPTRRFVEAFLERMRVCKGDVGADPVTHDLVRARERSLKGSRSRFDNKGALDRWGGSSGTGRLVYRWTIARRFLADLYPALGRS